ncbi:HdeD family acid-resistance protein [Actinomycetospora sp.]|uniref:HdeD family acid-resistance protein n=1 Tax=Actinomycetospora sp. TaxID=1872135 RepID=UPI0039C86018
MSMTGDGHRSGWDIVLGIVLVVVGLVVLANAALATIVSIYFIGWAAVVGGIVMLVQAIVRRKAGSVWSYILGGAVLLVLGVFVLRNPASGLVTLTLLAGALFLVTGVTRIAVSGAVPEGRWVLVTSGIVSVLLGVLVLVNLMAASVFLLGILLGVQTLLEGVTVLVAGRQPASGAISPPRATGAPA